MHLCSAQSPHGAKLAKDTLGFPSESDGSPVPGCPSGTLLPYDQVERLKPQLPHLYRAPGHGPDSCHLNTSLHI